MKCNKCGETYRGLAGDCSCTAYSDGTPRAYSVVSYEEMMRLQYADAKRAEIARLATEAEAFAAMKNMVIMIQKNRDGSYAVKPFEAAPEPEPKPLVGRATNILDGREV